MTSIPPSEDAGVDLPRPARHEDHAIGTAVLAEQDPDRVLLHKCRRTWLPDCATRLDALVAARGDHAMLVAHVALLS